MPRIRALRLAEASGRARELLEQVNDELGMTPNFMRVLASSPAALEGMLAFCGALATGALSPRLRESIALAVAEASGCGYCLAAHAAIGRSVGLSDDAVRDARAATSTDGREAAALAFARRLVDTHGAPDDRGLERLRSAGFGDGQVVEIVAHVALGIFACTLNRIAGTEIDFPPVTPLGPLGRERPAGSGDAGGA